MNYIRTSLGGLLFAGLLSAASFAAPALTVGTGSGQAGSQVDIPVTFDPTTASVASLQFDITLPASISTVSVTAGSILNNAQKSISTNVSGSTWRFIIFGLNQNAIAAGPLLTARIKLGATLAAGTYPLALSNVVYSDPNGGSVTAGTNTNGSVTVASAGNPAVTLSKSVNRTTVTPGGILTYTISYQNNGTAAATNVVIRDVVPTGTTVVAGSISNGGILSGGTITWSLGSVAAGATGSVSFQAQVQ